MLTLKNNEENESSEMSGPLYLLIQLRRLEVEVQGLEQALALWIHCRRGTTRI
jgi:hypothetical protein